MVKIDLPVFLLQLITFLIAMPLIWTLFIGSLSRTLKKRDDFIRESLDKIEKDRADMETMKNDYEKRIAEMQAGVKAAMDKALSDGDKMKQKMTEDARAEGARLIAEAKNEIENEKKRAIEEVKNTIVDISIMAAETVIRKKITKKEQMAVVDRHIKDIEKNVN